MRLQLSSSVQHLGKLLRTHYAQMTDEPLPQRWVDLINYLNERERGQALKPQRKTEPDAQH